MLAFLKDVYNQMLLFLATLWIIAAFAFGMPAVTNVLAAVITAFVLDAGINYYKLKKIEVPKSGIISGFFVGLIVPFSVMYAITGAALAILSKHLIMYKKRHLFNPAAFGILASSVLGFSTSWWVATTPLLVLFGIMVVYNIRRWWTTVSFLAAYGLAAIAAHVVAFRAVPDVPAIFNFTLLFFALFMLIEPRTSPHMPKAMAAFGICAGVLAAAFQSAGAPADPLLLALLIANLATGFLNTTLR